MDLVEDELQLVEDLLLELVYLAPDLLASIEVLTLDAGLEGLYLGTLVGVRARSSSWLRASISG